MKMYEGVEIYELHHSGSRRYMEVSGQIHAPAALPQGKSPRYPLYKRLGGPQSRSGRHGPGLEPRPLSRPARSQSLYRLRYPGSWQMLG
jgi:hypothetical protein